MKKKELTVASIRTIIREGGSVKTKFKPFLKEELAEIAEITITREKIELNFPKNFVLKKDTPNFIRELYYTQKGKAKKYVYRNRLTPEQKAICSKYNLKVTPSECEIKPLRRTHRT